MTLQAAIVRTLGQLRRARWDGDLAVIDRTERHLNDLLDMVPRTTRKVSRR